MKLELKHLAPYLPYGLEAQTLNVKWHKKKGFQDMGDTITTSVVSMNLKYARLQKKNMAAFDRGYNDFKPILRPLSELTKEKTWKEETAPYYWFISLEDTPEQNELLALANGEMEFEDVSYKVAESLCMAYKT